MSNQNLRQADSSTNTVTYPHLVVRIFAAVYQREGIEIRVGPPAVEIVNRRCAVQHPEPFAADGTISAACRALLIQGVQSAVRQLRFRICIVWAETRCTYVETDSTHEGTEPPSGGVLPGELAFMPQRYEPVQTLSDETPGYGLVQKSETRVPPSEVDGTRAALNDYLERKAQPPSPQLQAKRARLLKTLSGLNASSSVAKETEYRSQPTYSFFQQSGRRVWLNAFHFDQIYAGLIVGLPNNSPGYILDQKTKAQRIWGSRPTFTIPPATIIREDGARKYESFPWYCYKAWLTSDELDSRNAGSELIVIWFAEEPMELSLIATVEHACREVPWEQYAQDWNF
jgi:hypothetical protein